MQGDLAEGAVPGLLRELYVGRRTGTLHFAKGEEKQSVRVHRGHIVNAHTNVTSERLGEILVRRGRITADDFARATEVSLQGNKRLGQAFLELGLMDESGLEDAVAMHVHELLAKVFTWNEGTYSFAEEEESPREFTLKLSTADLILDAVRAISDPDVVRYQLGDMDRVLALSNDPLLRFQQLTLSPADGFVLSRVDGALSAREIEQLIPLPPEEVRKSLLGLLSTGIVEYESETRAAPEREAATPVPPPRAVGAPTEGSTSAAAAAAPTAPPESAEPLPPAASQAPAAAPPSEARETPAAASAPPPEVPETPPAPSSPSPAGPAPAAAPAPPPPPTEPPPLSPPEAPAPASPPAAPATAGGPPEPKPKVEGATDERRREILEAWEGLKTRNHFEVLGIARSSTASDVKTAYFSLAKRFHPDVHHGASLGDLRDKLEEVFIRLGEAYEVLRDTDKRREYEERLGRSRTGTGQPLAAAATPEVSAAEQAAARAEEAVSQAEALYKKEKYWDAIQLVEPIVASLSDKAQLRAQLVLARCLLENPNWVKRAEETLRDATRNHPEAVEAWALLGSLYRGQNLRARARNAFRRVLELRPDDGEAKQYLGETGTQKEPPTEEGGGFLKKIFGR